MRDFFVGGFVFDSVGYIHVICTILYADKKKRKEKHTFGLVWCSFFVFLFFFKEGGFLIVGVKERERVCVCVRSEENYISDHKQ